MKSAGPISDGSFYWRGSRRVYGSVVGSYPSDGDGTDPLYLSHLSPHSANLAAAPFSLDRYSDCRDREPGREHEQLETLLFGVTDAA